MGSSFQRAGYSDTLKTPSFGDIGSMPAPPDLGAIETSPATNVDIARDLHGPWIFLAAPALEGELFVRRDGIVLFRPGNQLGYGIGRLKVSHTIAGSAVAEIELETYLFEATSKSPPLEPSRYKFAVALSVASAPSQNYKTFTMHGHATTGGGSGSTNAAGAVNAAKLEPWDSTKFGQEWQPNPQLAQGFQVLFPRKFTLSRLEQHRRSAAAGVPPSAPFNLQDYKVGTIDSVYYVPEYVTADEERECLVQNKETPAELKNQLDRRVVQEYGGTMCPECNKSFVSDANLPPWSNTICQALVADRVFSPCTFPNNVRIHDYEVGHGIAPHCDGPIYVPRVAILSLAAPVLMSFYRRREPYGDDVMQHYEDTFRFDGDIAKERPLFSLVLQPRSLLVFEKDAYTYHPHGISANAEDSLDEAVVGPIANRHLLVGEPLGATLKRQHRVGVTIRNLLPRCAHEPQRAEYQMIEAAKVSRPDWFAPSSTAGAVAAKNVTATASKPSSTYGAMSKAPPLSSTTNATTTAAAAVPAVSPALERKLDEMLQRQERLERQLKEVQTVLAFATQRNLKFETDVAGVLDHVSQLVLETSGRVEDIAAALEEGKR